MLEPIGDFEVSKSEDFVGNLFGLSDALNEFSWSYGDEKWGVYQTKWGYHLMTGKRGKPTTNCLVSPTLFPEFVSAVYVELDDGKNKLIRKPNSEDISQAHEFVYELVSLKILVEKLTPFIEAGSFEISCWINENQRGICLERLKISADGSAERNRFVSGQGSSLDNFSEKLPAPKNLACEVHQVSAEEK